MAFRSEVVGTAIGSGRYGKGPGSIVADGWHLKRITPPSRLFGANGLRTGVDGRIYVAQVPGSQVSAIDVDTGVIDVFSPMGGAITGPDDLVFDEEGNLYVTEITENQVRVLRPNGSSQVIQGDMPVANPITYHQGRLIAGELRMDGRIMELNRDGGAPRVILANVPMVNAFDVGPDGMLYFPAQAANEIWRVNIDGGEPEVVARNLGVPDSVKFHPDGYIVSTQVHSGQVLRIDPLTGAQSVLADIAPGLDNVTFVGKRIFVSHITGSVHEITAPGHVHALIDKGLQWPLGLAVGQDGDLFVADGAFDYSLGESGQLELIGMMFTPGFPGWTRGVAAAGRGEWIVTTANGTLARWRPAMRESEELATGYDRLMGVAVGKGGAVVFAEMPTGRVLSVEGGRTSELAHGLDMPMGVAMGADGTVYVAEAGAGRIVKLSGGKSEIVIDGLHRPHGIAVLGNKLYWVDIIAKTVSEYDLQDGERRVIASNLPVGVPAGVVVKSLGAVGDLCGPMDSFTGLAVGADGCIFIAADAEGSVIELRPS